MIQDQQLAEASAATYRNPATGQIADIYWCNTAVGESTVVAFRGTVTAANWLRDLNWKPTLDEDLGWCHRGFLAGARLFLEKFVGDRRPLILTGHSLGGALALTVGALMLGRPIFDVSSIVTFGAPRVGMGKFVQRLSTVSIRQYRRGNDPVTEVPIAVWPFWFQHARAPLIGVGTPARVPISCHSANGYVLDTASDSRGIAAFRPAVLSHIGTIVIDKGAGT